jgi:hypothetical protein
MKQWRGSLTTKGALSATIILKAAAKTIEAALFALWVIIIFFWIGQRDCWQ